MPRFSPRACVNRVALFCCLISPVALAATSPTHRPPTFDPTYGRRESVRKSKPQVTPGKNAQWIWTAAATDTQIVGARKAFELLSVPKKAILYVTADNLFTASINGKEVGKSVAVPAGYEWRTVHAIDVSKDLQSGKNVLAVQGKNTGGSAGILAALVVGIGKNAREIVTDATWKVKTDPPAGWDAVDSDDSSWDSATPEAPLGGGVWMNLEGWPGLSTLDYLNRMPMAPEAVLEVSSGKGQLLGAETLIHPNDTNFTVIPAPDSRTEGDAPSLILDFGRELTGRVEIESDSNAPAAVMLAYGESRDEAVENPYGGPQQLDLAPHSTANGRDSAFRYAKITFVAGANPLRIKAIRLSHLYYPVEYKGSFASSDLMLDRIWYAGVFTSHLCMQEDIWDASKRDRLRWMGDLHVSGEVINNAFLDRFLMEQTMDRLRSDAGTPIRSHVNGIPGYSCAWVAGAADYYRHTGELGWIKKHHDDLIELMDYFRGELDDRGIFANKRGQWPFVDWSPNFNGVDPHALSATHLFMVYMLKQGGWLLREMDDATSAEKYEAWAREATDAAQKYLTNGDTQTFGNRWQDNSMAIYSGVATPEQRAAIFDKVLGKLYPVEQMITPYYNNYTIAAMSESGHTADALKFIRWYWGGMMEESATSLWEGYDPRWQKDHFHKYLQADNGMGYFVSLSHGWSAGATNWLTEQLLGVRSTSAGFKTADIQPDLVDLTWAKGDIPTPRGPIRVSYTKVGNALHAEIDIPKGTEAKVTLPGQASQTLKSGHHRL